MEYKILMNSDRQLLANVVESYLKEGWEPQGGVSVAVKNDNDEGYVQAIIKR